MEQDQQEEFTIKVEAADRGFKWLRKNGSNVVLRSRKALRNFIKNNVHGEYKLYRNGQPFTLGDNS